MVIITVPATLAPAAGAVISTAADGVGVTVGVGEPVGVGVDEPLATVTVIAELPIAASLLLKAEAEIVCVPFGTVVESQEKVLGGDEAK